VADRAAVPHHCLDLVEPDHDFTVAEFAGIARPAITDIEERGATPLLVAGTGLYLRSVTDPMEIPGTWPDVRASLEARLGSEPPELLHAELAAIDPAAAAKIEPGNARRTVRALEVCLGSGRRFSSFGPGIDSYPLVAFLQVGLLWPRDVLAKRIEERVHRMIASGLVDEVARLISAHRLSRTAMQALGYKEIVEHLEGSTSLDQATEQIVVRTRQFAVRQLRWFRRDPRVQWVSIEDDPVAEAVPVIEGLLER
jgi:tRNA dimethylallyltransferase